MYCVIRWGRMGQKTGACGGLLGGPGAPQMGGVVHQGVGDVVRWRVRLGKRWTPGGIESGSEWGGWAWVGGGGHEGNGGRGWHGWVAGDRVKG